MDWGVRFVRPALLTRLTYLQPARNVARFLAYAAQAAQGAGDDSEAIERVRDLLRENRALDERPLLLISHLVALGVAAQASQAATELAPRLRVANPGAGTESNGILAAPVQVRALIDELLDDRSQRDGSRKAWEAEAMGTIEAADWIATPGSPGARRP